MNNGHIQLISGILAELLSAFLPFLGFLRGKWRYSLIQTTGILLAYLILVCLFVLVLPNSLTSSLFVQRTAIFLSMLAMLLTGFCLVKVNFLFAAYILFLFRNITDAAILLSQLFVCATLSPEKAVGGIFYLLFFRFFFLVLICRIAYLLISPYLAQAVKYTYILPLWKYLCLIPIIFFAVFHFSLGSYFFSNMELSDIKQLSVALFWLICMLAVHFVILRILFSLTQSCAINDQYRTSKLITSIQTSQMAGLRYSLEQMTNIRHDIRYHIITVRGLLNQNKTEAALKYINEYLGSAKSFHTTQYCLNLSVNSLLNYYLQEASEKSIQVSSSISLPRILPLPEIDFCTILGNLLANALEACQCQESGQPLIVINIGQAGDSMITLSIRNSYTHEIREKEGHLLSSKDGRIGIGTSSVRYLVEQYHGVLNYKYNNGMFETSILLNPHMG